MFCVVERREGEKRRRSRRDWFYMLSKIEIDMGIKAESI